MSVLLELCYEQDTQWVQLVRTHTYMPLQDKLNILYSYSYNTI